MNKLATLKGRDAELTSRISSLSDSISRTEQDLAADDLTLLQVKISWPAALEFPGSLKQDSDVLTECQEKLFCAPSCFQDPH